jgi:hypothetical protein
LKRGIIMRQAFPVNTFSFSGRKKQMKKNREITEEFSVISYGRLVFEAIPEIFSFQIFSSLVLGVVAWAMSPASTVIC